MGDVAPMTVAQVSALEIKATWKVDGDFSALMRAGCALGAAREPRGAAGQVGMQLLEACAACGHVSFITDYIHEVCGDSSVSSTSVDQIRLLDGDLVCQWLSASLASLEKELDSICTNGNQITDETLLSKMRTRLLSYTAANEAMRSVGLGAKSVPPDQLLRLAQLVSVLCWLAGQSCSLESGSRRHRDHFDFQEDAAQRRKALQRLGLLMHSILGSLQGMVESDVSYPFHSLGTCLRTMFLRERTAKAGEATQRDGRAQVLLYYLWDCGFTDGCKVRPHDDAVCLSCFSDRS